MPSGSRSNRSRRATSASAPCRSASGRRCLPLLWLRSKADLVTHLPGRESGYETSRLCMAMPGHGAGCRGCARRLHGGTELQAARGHRAGGLAKQPGARRLARRSRLVGTLQGSGRRFEQGLSTQLDVDRADAEAAVAAATVPDLERRIVQNETGLSVLLGRNPGPIARGTPLDGQRLPPEVPAGLPAALLERRPDIRQAEQTLLAANARIGVAKAEYFPKITLTGVLGVESVALSDLFTGGSRFWSIGPAMSVPLFTAGRTRNTVKGFEARQQQAAAPYPATIQQAFREVEDALVSHRKVRDIRAERERRVTANRRALSMVTLRYDRGLSTQLEVLDIQRELFSAELEFASATRDQLTAVVQLYRALGGGWQGQPEPSIDGIK